MASRARSRRRFHSSTSRLTGLHRLLLTARAHVPLAKGATAAIVIELNQEDVVVLAHKLPLRGVFEVAASALSHRDAAVDGDGFVARRIGPWRVLLLEPGGHDRDPAANRLVERKVGIGRVSAKELGHGFGIVGFPGPDIRTQPAGNALSGEGHSRGRVYPRGLKRPCRSPS